MRSDLMVKTTRHHHASTYCYDPHRGATEEESPQGGLQTADRQFAMLEESTSARCRRPDNGLVDQGPAFLQQTYDRKPNRTLRDSAKIVERQTVDRASRVPIKIALRAVQGKIAIR